MSSNLLGYISKVIIKTKDIDALMSVLGRLRAQRGFARAEELWYFLPGDTCEEAHGIDEHDLERSERTLSLMTLKGACKALDTLAQSARQQLTVQQRKDDNTIVQKAVRDLPDDIVKYIFELACLPDIKDSIAPFDNAAEAKRIALSATRLSHVDSHFRKVALQQPLLWSVLSNEQSENQFMTFLQRSGEAPVTISLGIPGEGAISQKLFIEAITGITHRWKEFSVDNIPVYTKCHSLLSTLQGMALQLPELRGLHLPTEGQQEYRRIHFNLPHLISFYELWYMPKLASLSSYFFAAESAGSILSAPSLENVSLRQCRLTIFNRTQEAWIRPLLDFFEQTQSLEELTVDFFAPFGVEENTQPTNANLFHYFAGVNEFMLPNLKKLRIIVSEFFLGGAQSSISRATLAGFTSALKAPQLTDVSITVGGIRNHDEKAYAEWFRSGLALRNLSNIKKLKLSMVDCAHNAIRLQECARFEALDHLQDLTIETNCSNMEFILPLSRHTERMLPSLHTVEISTGDHFDERGFAYFLHKLESRSPFCQKLRKVTLSRKANPTALEFVERTIPGIPVEKLLFREH